MQYGVLENIPDAIVSVQFPEVSFPMDEIQLPDCWEILALVEQFPATDSILHGPLWLLDMASFRNGTTDTSDGVVAHVPAVASVATTLPSSLNGLLDLDVVE
jgi:hypothetical protein